MHRAISHDTGIKHGQYRAISCDNRAISCDNRAISCDNRAISCDNHAISCDKAVFAGRPKSSLILSCDTDLGLHRRQSQTEYS